jgi:glucose-6-phosphate 1-epimerase
VSSWIPSEALGEQLFVAQQSEFAAGRPIRGGVPVCCPQFASFGSGVKHGFARLVEWQLASVSDDQAEAVFRLTATDETRSHWPHAFELLFTVILKPEQLLMTLTVNNCGDEDFSFSGALHTYFATHCFTDVQLTDFTGATYWDNGTPLSDKKVYVDGPLQLVGAFDRVYFDAPDQLQFVEGGKELAIAKQGFTDVVVWNPGAEGVKNMVDMGDDEFHSMLCVEAAIVDKPVTLAAGASWQGVQSISVRSV